MGAYPHRKKQTNRLNIIRSLCVLLQILFNTHSAHTHITARTTTCLSIRVALLSKYHENDARTHRAFRYRDVIGLTVTLGRRCLAKSVNLVLEPRRATQENIISRAINSINVCFLVCMTELKI